MTRPIKFRAWDKKEGAMTAPLYDHAPLVGSINVNIVIEHLQSSDSTLMQFTGLLDKNGKEIYESDFVKTPAGTGTVEWKNGCYWLVWSGGGRTTLHDVRLSHREVTGNKYEN